MHHDHDVRALGARLWRTVLAVALGFPLALGVALLLPTRDHFPIPPGGCGFGHGTGHLVEGGDPVVMFAGGVALSLAAYALLGLRCRSREDASVR